MERKRHDWRKDQNGAVAPQEKYLGIEICPSVTFGQTSAAKLARLFAGEEWGFIYQGMARGNPTVEVFETAHAKKYDLPQHELYWSYAVAMGNTAIFCLAMYLLRGKKRKVVSAASVYGGTYGIFKERLPELNMSCAFVEDGERAEAWEAAIDEQTAFLFLESPTNPHGLVYDIEMVARIAHKHGCLLVVDNTIGTSALSNPFAFGADIVVDSVTKGENGHSTAGGGAVTGTWEFINDGFRQWMQAMRPTMDARAATQHMVGLRTLEMRMRRHSDNAHDLLRELAMLPFIAEPRYPFWRSEGHAQGALARKQMKGGGPLCTIDLLVPSSPQDFLAFRRATREESFLFLNMLVKEGPVTMCAHIGHATTLVIHPASTTHAKVSEAVRKRLGINDNTIRISAGSESPKAFKQVISHFKKTLKEWLECVSSKE